MKWGLGKKKRKKKEREKKGEGLKEQKKKKWRGMSSGGGDLDQKPYDCDTMLNYKELHLHCNYLIYLIANSLIPWICWVAPTLTICISANPPYKS